MSARKAAPSTQSYAIPAGTARQNPAPLPPPPVAGQKRALRSPTAHAFENGKLRKFHILDHVVPLMLNEESIPHDRAERYAAPLPARASTAGGTQDVRGWTASQPGVPPSQGFVQMVPQSEPHEGFYHGYPFDPAIPQLYGFPQTRGYPPPNVHPSAAFPPAHAAPPSYAFPQNVHPSAAFPPAHAAPPSHAFPQADATQMPSRTADYNSHGHPQGSAHVRPRYVQPYVSEEDGYPGYANQSGSQVPETAGSWERGQASLRPGFPNEYQQQHVGVDAYPRYTNQSDYQIPETAPRSWEQGDAPRASGFSSEHQQPRAGENVTSFNENPSEAREGSSMAVDHDEGSPAFVDKGKGKATSSYRGTQRIHDDAGIPSTTPEPSSAPNVDQLSNSFGVMLLNHVQQSHDEMSKKISEFMAQQNEAQERLRHTVTHEFRAVHAKVQHLQNPLPLHGHRRSGRSAPAARGMESPLPQQSPKSPATPKRARADRAKPPSVGADMEYILTTLKASVRQRLKELLHFDSWEELVSRQPPLTEEEIKTYRRGGKSATCSEENLRIDFIHEWKRLPLNLAARDFFVQNMLKCIKGGAFDFDSAIIPSITERHVEYALDNHMEYCRRKYREAYNRQSWDSDDDEDADKIAKQDEKVEKVKKRKAQNSRKKTLLDTRLFVILDQGLSRHALLFSLLLPQNMSGDETDGPERRLPMAYRIIESRWQSLVFKIFLRALDAKYRAAWEKPKPGKRAVGGNPPRTRISRADGRSEDGYAPPGLWRNCYDSDWLRSLEPYQRRALRIVNSDYDFDLTPELDEDEDMGDDEEDIDAEGETEQDED